MTDDCTVLQLQQIDFLRQKNRVYLYSPKNLKKGFVTFLLFYSAFLS